MARNLPDLWRGDRGAFSAAREMTRLQHQINRMFDDFFGEPMFSSLPQFTRGFLPRREELEYGVACDVEESDKSYLLTFDLPGMKKDDVKIDLHENVLTVSGERKEETKGEGKGKVSRERYYGAFQRSFTLPQNVDADKVEAHYENGVLQIALPKTALAPGKQIPIKEGKLIESKREKAA